MEPFESGDEALRNEPEDCDERSLGLPKFPENKDGAVESRFLDFEVENRSRVAKVQDKQEPLGTNSATASRLAPRPDSGSVCQMPRIGFFPP